MGGEIGIDSTKGKAACFGLLFYVNLPIRMYLLEKVIILKMSGYQVEV